MLFYFFVFVHLFIYFCFDSLSHMIEKLFRTTSQYFGIFIVVVAICWNLIELAGGRHFQAKVEIHKLTPIHEDEIKLPIIRIMKWQNKEIELHNNILSVVRHFHIHLQYNASLGPHVYAYHYDLWSTNLPPLPFCSYFILLLYYWCVPNS